MTSPVNQFVACHNGKEKLYDILALLLLMMPEM